MRKLTCVSPLVSTLHFGPTRRNRGSCERIALAYNGSAVRIVLTKYLRGGIIGLIAVLAAQTWADYPPLCLEIGPDHPLFLFQDTGAECADTAAYAQHAIQAWQQLPADFRAFSAIQVEARGTDTQARHAWFRRLLATLQEADLPTVIRIGDGRAGIYHPLDRIEELLNEFTCVKGVQAVDIPIEDYPAPGTTESLGPPPPVKWLADGIEGAARYGRFYSIALDEIRWLRVMANESCQPLYQRMRECAPYLIPIATCRGAHVIPQISALMGLWLEGATGQWGVGPDSRWYRDARFVAPGVFGVAEPPAKMPSALYRAMILDGAMTGAAVYAFTPDTDLWFGPARAHWDDAIEPTLRQLLDLNLIARKEFVLKKARVAYQAGVARTPQEFHVTLHDADAVLDTGNLIQAAYGMERTSQVAELIPNSGRYYWIPILSAISSEAVSTTFEVIVAPGTQTSVASWRELLDRYYQPDGEGTAFISNVGRGLFIMNTRENIIEPQNFKIPAVPAPVRGFEAKRQDDGVLVTWPFREGDLSYKVYRRIPPDPRWNLLASNAENRRYLDAAADPAQTIAYAVTALTEDKEPYEGVVNYGEYLALSNVESRIADEVVIGPLLGLAQSQPVTAPTTNPQPNPGPWWMTLTGLSDAQQPIALAISQRIEALDAAFCAKNLDGVIDVYSADYEDATGWRILYTRRAYQWFFEHYNACRMDRQIRQWDFSGHEGNGQVNVLVYCRFSGYAISDPTGRVADLPAWFPRENRGETSLTFVEQDGAWRIVRSNPALPNMRDILGFSASPFDNLPVGPDQ